MHNYAQVKRDPTLNELRIGQPTLTGTHCVLRFCVALKFKWITFLRALSLNRNLIAFRTCCPSDVYLFIFISLEFVGILMVFFQRSSHFVSFRLICVFLDFLHLCLATKWKVRSEYCVNVCFFVLLKTIRWPSYMRTIMDRITCGEMDRQ